VTYGAYVMPAVRSVYYALQQRGLNGTVKLTVPMDAGSTFGNTYPPSVAEFQEPMKPIMLEMAQFLAETHSFLTVNLYPFVSLKVGLHDVAGRHPWRVTRAPAVSRHNFFWQPKPGKRSRGLICSGSNFCLNHRTLIKLLANLGTLSRQVGDLISRPLVVYGHKQRRQGQSPWRMSL
jgi:hypothetical protein